MTLQNTNWEKKKGVSLMRCEKNTIGSLKKKMTRQEEDSECIRETFGVIHFTKAVFWS